MNAPIDPPFVRQPRAAVGARRLLRVVGICAAAWMLAPVPACAENPSKTSWGTREKDGRLEVLDAAGKVVLAWQTAPLAGAKGGAKFAASAFLHPLTTPSGFVVTAIQPPDHLHHLGVWWPWKFLTVDGQKLNGWEIQEGQARHVARSVKVLHTGATSVALELNNAVEQLKDQPQPRDILTEKTLLTVSRPTANHYAIDFAIDQQPAGGRQVTLPVNHYSGFSFRGPVAWNQANSKLFTSEGHDRDHANGQPARWICVTGPGKDGPASVVILSGAAKRRLAPERLRVWDSKNTNGMPFINFNPVATAPLDATAPAAARRDYRMLVADGEWTADEAERAWQAWDPLAAAKAAGGK